MNEWIGIKCRMEGSNPISLTISKILERFTKLSLYTLDNTVSLQTELQRKAKGREDF
jgi:hypothetical protein